MGMIGLRRVDKPIEREGREGERGRREKQVEGGKEGETKGAMERAAVYTLKKRGGGSLTILACVPVSQELTYSFTALNASS